MIAEGEEGEVVAVGEGGGGEGGAEGRKSNTKAFFKKSTGNLLRGGDTRLKPGSSQIPVMDDGSGELPLILGGLLAGLLLLGHRPALVLSKR